MWFPWVQAKEATPVETVKEPEQEKEEEPTIEEREQTQPRYHVKLFEQEMQAYHSRR